MAQVEDRGIKFLVDEMHNKLCVWLRLLGYDAKGSKDYEVKYGPSVADKNLIVEALEEGRVLLTGDKQMFEIITDKAQRQNKQLTYKNTNIPHAVKIRQDVPENQLIALHKVIPLEYNLNFDAMCCTDCGGKNVKVENKEDVRGKVVDGVFNDVDQFWKCSKCGKVFWVGSQTKNIVASFDKMMELLKESN
ncbi:hypothetical protein EIN_175710 [Entamoeba invadens IP1]|uniref:hypothetical protein n=1 Tax=Entamoeba invadens IP1 TaxID=370355 RepID=UPI0002C3FBE7|nr:hypothetical protein EIN_175710 [Entamoeba invadens IP1]ELP93784.1 hypothetical protein EIN_175710 [Entamoeba invadens IP1]|eukprot:XP_004260555.1 hypothetical protein EIN_175710 [Entamoeba invadens IP1]